jgi:hypothetical protein
MTTHELFEPVDATGDQVWDDLHRLYCECRTTAATPIQILPLLKDPEKLKTVDSPKLLVDQARVLSKDMAHYSERLEAIYNQHRHRSGNSTDPDELMVALAYGEEYQQWLADFQTIVLPIVEEVLEQFN